MSDAQKLMTEVLREHQYNGADLGHYGPRVEYCVCGWGGPGEQVHEEHQANEIDKALGGLARGYRVSRDSWHRNVAGEKVPHTDHVETSAAQAAVIADGWDKAYVESRWVSSWRAEPQT
ncbi:hypothetical protein [Mycobacterium sp. CnD-18-1]|uniref:hypothetical protein n=1 Tax=Mycobacterium sp. CnD-18-1 TaxID=2917744 RepID=UPI001EF3D06D|nr:hypothetical protein [Mycobacterium sp. CnD-18-1]MCG7607126.1 hypothetical protein [Mycobacterium sp. CnD-18-1]